MENIDEKIEDATSTVRFAGSYDIDNYIRPKTQQIREKN